MIPNPQYSLAKIIKPFTGFEDKYNGLDPEGNPIAIPGSLDPHAGEAGYDPNLLAGIPVPMGARIFLWLPRYFPTTYGVAALNYRYRFVWRLRSLPEQNAQKPSHFGLRLKGTEQETYSGGDPEIASLNAGAGERFVIPAAFESVQIINNKFYITDVGNGPTPIQKGTTSGSAALNPSGQDPADIAVVQARTNTYADAGYQAPLSPEYPGPVSGTPKQGAAGLLSQGYYPDQAGWVTNSVTKNQGYAAGGQYVLYDTEVKGDELLLLLDRETGATGAWDFTGADRNVSRILGTDGGTKKPVPTLGIYLLTGAGAAPGQSYG